MPQALLDEARQKFAPDHRTAVFDVRGVIDGGSLTLSGCVQDSVMKDQLLRFIREKTQYTIVDSIAALPDPSVGEKMFGVVDVSVANLRTHPEHPAEMASQAILGTPVRILRKEHGWYLVQTPDDYLGWTDDRLVRMAPDRYRDWAAKPKVIATVPLGWVLQAKDKSAQPVSDIVAGAILASRGNAGEYREVEYPDGRRGFLPRGDGEPLDAWLGETHDTPERIVATAKRFFGVPYLWGGTSAKGMDCSGFTKTVYFLNGVLLPRDADQQARVGDSVEIPAGTPSLKPGDLLFFGKKADGRVPGKISHVAISLGGARFIHSSGDVHINSLDPADADFSDFRAVSFLGARRVIGAGETSGVRRLATLSYYHANEH